MRITPLHLTCALILLAVSEGIAQVAPHATNTALAYLSPPAAEFPRSKDFIKVEIRGVGSETWSEVAVYNHESSFAGQCGIAAFGLAGAVEVRVTCPSNVTSAEVLPSFFKIPANAAASQVSFVLKEPRNVIVNVNGSIDHPLCLFANPIELRPPSESDPAVDFYAAGKVHQIRKTQKKRIYIEGGAVVKGAIDMGSDTTVSGFGMLFTDINTNPLKSWGGQNIAIRDIIVYNFGPGLHKQGNWSYLMFATKHVVVDNVKFFDVYYGEDGIDPDGDCQDVTIKNCFFHLGDDGVALKASSWQSQGNIPQDILITNNVFWQDKYGNPIHIGNETWSTQSLTGLKVVNNWVVRALADNGFPKDSLIRIEAAQGATIEGMEVDGFYVENSDRPSLCNFEVSNHENSKGLGAIRNLKLNNVQVRGKWVPCDFAGLDVDHPIENIVFSNLWHNDRQLSSPQEAKFNVGVFVKNISVSGPAGTQSVDGQAAEPWRAVSAKPLSLDVSAFKLENAKLTLGERGFELLADEQSSSTGQALAAVTPATGIVTFKTTVRPMGEKFPYPNFAVVVGNSKSGQRITAFFDPNTGEARLTQGTRQNAIKRDSKSAGFYFAKSARTITVTVDIPARTIHYLVGDWAWSVAFADGFDLDAIDRIGFDSYRTGAVFSQLRFGSNSNK